MDFGEPLGSASVLGGEQADSLPMEPSEEAGKVRSSFTMAPGEVGRGGARWGEVGRVHSY